MSLFIFIRFSDDCRLAPIVLVVAVLFVIIALFVIAIVGISRRDGVNKHCSWVEVDPGGVPITTEIRIQAYGTLEVHIQGAGFRHGSSLEQAAPAPLQVTS